ncbi:hypothetical protein Fot_14354 [Forsythia ovata]|uniref:Uncharacterized protein n=1 Tax=Forsythia ovata TaxID=205694 RepID=A0ABD1W6J2_9LAMI
MELISTVGDSDRSHSERRKWRTEIASVIIDFGFSGDVMGLRVVPQQAVVAKEENGDSVQKVENFQTAGTGSEKTWTPVAGGWYHGPGVSPATGVVVSSTETGEDFSKFRARIWGLCGERKEGAEWGWGVWGDQIWV